MRSKPHSNADSTSKCDTYCYTNSSAFVADSYSNSNPSAFVPNPHADAYPNPHANTQRSLTS